MADKVEAIMEQMTEELQYYLREELFSKREVKRIVKERRNFEYRLQRKDANLLFFLDSIKFEKKLDRLRAKRVHRQNLVDVGKQRNVFMDHSVSRRVMHLYDRATRKFKKNIALWKEYMEYLVKKRAFQKLNRLLSKCVQIHPTVLDFWLIGVYTELDIKGNLFSGRKLMLQAIRNNPENPSFFVEYFRFEVRFFEKVKQRIMILNGDDDKKVDFITEEED
jgi:U3 small nucleolar RNA-associated protein 6